MREGIEKCGNIEESVRRKLYGCVVDFVGGSACDVRLGKARVVVGNVGTCLAHMKVMCERALAVVPRPCCKLYSLCRSCKTAGSRYQGSM